MTSKQCCLQLLLFFSLIPAAIPRTVMNFLYQKSVISQVLSFLVTSCFYYISHLLFRFPIGDICMVPSVQFISSQGHIVSVTFGNHPSCCFYISSICRNYLCSQFLMRSLKDITFVYFKELFWCVVPDIYHLICFHTSDKSVLK